jgi:dTDP-4-dehydrorhamnose reductase
LAPNRDATGIFHIGASDKLSRFDLAKRLAEKLGYAPSLIVAQEKPAEGRAPRGPDDFLVPDRIRQFCHTPIPNCQTVIERSVHAIA